MATGTETGRSNPQPIPQPSHRGAPAPNAASAVSPPSRRELASWWKKFRKTTEKDEEKVNTIPGIFGVPLAESIRYANVAISLTNEQGESFIYGYVPIVVAKCGVFLKEKATDVEGVFRLSGSAKRIKELETIFNSPDRYGKGLDWTGYTVHDAANILRRYLNRLPEPIVPLGQYEKFRDPLRELQQRLEKQPPNQSVPEISATDHATAVTAYQRLITELPALNRQLLLYILDLLAVFSSKSDLNRMNAANLAAIFQPGIISHPDHDMAPHEYRLSQDVLIFLIENQDNFLIGMSGTGLDEKTQKEVESGAPSVKSPKSNIGRSASNASAGADSLRRYGIRRNVSVSSHASRERTSPNVSSPGTPASPSYTPGSGSIGVARSNTVPSKRSPAVGQHRFQRVADSSSPNSPVATNSSVEPGPESNTPEKQAVAAGQQNSTPEKANAQISRGQEATTVPFPDVATQHAEVQQILQATQPSTLQVPKGQSSGTNQNRERKISNLFSSKSPIFGPSDPYQNQSPRQPRKLQKRQKLPGSMNESAQSSAASLQDDPFHTPLAFPDMSYAQAYAEPTTNDSLATPTAAVSPNAEHHNEFDLAPPHAQDIHGRGSIQKSPATSLRSGTSMTDPSDFDTLDDPIAKAEKKRSRWRFSSAARKNDDGGPLVPPPPIGQLPGARTSNSSVGSSGRARQSFSTETYMAHQVPTDSSSAGHPSVIGQISHESNDPSKDSGTESEKKGLFGKWKAKMAQAKEERREREAEKERAKSPPRMADEHSSSRHSLSAFAHDHFSPRGRSFDKSREDVLPVVSEQSRVEQPRGSMSSGKAIPVAAVQNTAHIVAPQTASVTAPTIIPNTMPAGNANPAMAMVPPAAIGVAITSQSGPAVATSHMPKVEEEPRLEVNTESGQASAPDSVQHTPTEVKGPILEK